MMQMEKFNWAVKRGHSWTRRLKSLLWSVTITSAICVEFEHSYPIFIKIRVSESRSFVHAWWRWFNPRANHFLNQFRQCRLKYQEFQVAFNFPHLFHRKTCFCSRNAYELGNYHLLHMMSLGTAWTSDLFTTDYGLLGVGKIRIWG